MKKVVVLGCGRVGALMAKDLAGHKELEVTAVDASPDALKAFKSRSRIKTRRADLSDPAAVTRLVNRFDVAVGSVPGRMGFATMKAVIEAGVDYADISFFPEDPFRLDSRARAKGVTAIVDCGVAPGLSNMIVGHLGSTFERLTSVLIMVGGLPKKRVQPWEYKAPFSPADVIEEYVRPARLVRRGRVVTVPALTGVEMVKLPGVGTLEAFNTDGLRTLLRTVKAPEMKEKTLRYPGHADKARLLRDSGLFDQRPVKVAGVAVRPLDVTSRVLFPLWELGKGEDEFTVMRVEVEGIKDGKRVRCTYDLLDRYDGKTGETSMARTTGFPNAIAAYLLATGRFRRPGVCPPEYLGREKEVFDAILAGLRERGVRLRHKTVALRTTRR
jgi:saccharopine dehydrogenase-like NADP-dependent oxidoreductase